MQLKKTGFVSNVESEKLGVQLPVPMFVLLILGAATSCLAPIRYYL